MSMLAERKRKQRWSLNPRGNSWINDKNNIGQKMLEKMGWSHGKGLGASETGIKEQIKVSYKNDNKGMGYQRNDEQWVEHEDNFNQLLETLSNGNNNDDGNDKKIVSLVERSESSKVRVHYRKFTRGKDLSQYSEKDLANIFGKKSLKQRQMIENDDIGGGGEFEGSFMKNRGSMVDYFQQKSKQFQCNVDKVSGDEGEIRCNFGFISTPIDKGDNERKIDDNNESAGELKTIKKKRKRIDGENLENSREESETGNELVDENSQELSEGKKKKKKIVKIEIDEENCGKKTSKIVKYGANLETSNGNFQVVGKVKKRLKNWKINENGAIDNPVFNNLDSSLENSQDNCESGEQNPNFRVIKKVKKRLKSGKIEENGAIDNPVFNNSDLMENSHENFEQIENQSDELKTNFRIVGKVKKRFKNKENGAIDNPVFNSLDSSLENSYQTKENVIGKLKKRSKTRKIENNPALNTSNSSLENFRVVGKAEKRLKSGKIKENRAIDNPAFDRLDSSLENSQENQNQSLPTVGKSKKKQKNKIIENGAIDNPAFDDLDSSGEILGNSKKQSKLHKIGMKTNKILENPPDNNRKFEIKRKTKIPFDNPTFNHKNSTETTPIATTTTESEEISCDLMLNVVTTPILRTPNRKCANKGRNVRFSEINHERIIPNNDDLQKLNELTEINTQVINRNLEKFSQRIDGLEAEIENDMNEAKLHNTEGVVLKFNKNTKWGSVPIWLKKTKCTAKSSYKHLIRGDIVVNFKNTNLGEIPGYGKDLRK